MIKLDFLHIFHDLMFFFVNLQMWLLKYYESFNFVYILDTCVFLLFYFHFSYWICLFFYSLAQAYLFPH